MAQLASPIAEAAPGRHARPPSAESAAAVAAFALTALAIAEHGDSFVTAVYAGGVALTVTFALWRLAHHRDDRFARLLVVAGTLFALASLSQSDDSVLYSVGRTSVWFVELFLVYLILAFPTGRLTTTTERALAAATAATAILLYLPTAFLADFPEPAAWASCGTDCPSNAFVAGDGSTAVLDVVRPLREVITIVLWAAVAAVLVRRVRRAAPLARPAIAPVAWIAVARGVVMAVYLTSRAVAESSRIAEVLGIAYLMSLPAVTLAFAAGIVGQRLFVANALQDLTAGLRPHAGAAELRAAMAHALHDPQLRIVYWADGTPGRWVDETGWPIGEPQPEDGRAVTEVTSADGHHVAAIVHHAELAHDPGLIRAASAYALTTLENERLGRTLRASLDELHESRMRIVAATDAERRRIERDLHDGAQQRLVALRIKLGLLAEQAADREASGAAQLRQLGDEVESTIDEVRSFARAVYPPLLAEKGLAEALRAAARRSPIPTTIVARNVRRHPLAVESTVYFACVEALQNAAKHAQATNAQISISDNHRLRFEIHDNGVGFESGGTSGGAGLTNLRDRLAAVGGTLEVRSAPGKGTSVIGVVPN